MLLPVMELRMNEKNQKTTNDLDSQSVCYLGEKDFWDAKVSAAL